MKSFLISDKRDTWVGMRLAGVDGVVVNTRQEVLDAMNKAMKDDDIGIIMITEQLADLVQDELTKLKLRRVKPLIAEIPGRHGSMRPADRITEYIRNSVGIRI